MFQHLEIENFRGVQEGKVRDLAPLSVFVGQNNSGKSTILEALHFFASGASVEVAASLATRRGWCGLSCMEQLFYEAKRPAKVRLVRGEYPTNKEEASFELAPNRAVELLEILTDKASFQKAIQINANFQPSKNEEWILINEQGSQSDYLVPQHGEGLSWESLQKTSRAFVEIESLTKFGVLEDAFSAAVSAGKEAEIEALLARVGAAGQALRILKQGDKFVLHNIINGKAVSVYFSGDGYKRLLYIACVLAANVGGLVLLEEPEGFQHPAHLRELGQLFWGAIAQGTQVILSTHSQDLLQDIFLADNADLGKSALFHSHLRHGKLSAVRIEGERAKERMDSLSEDLRR